MKFKKLNETYWIDSKEVMDEVSKLGKELESDGFNFYSDRSVVTLELFVRRYSIPMMVLKLLISRLIS